ncbi:putative bifunctional diguanylate cyclase/phosphodiesterase [Trichloromonas sp.]|uniref:putative bifunctional diguanylate cyclase/phosphodiesterase n=1 Tax=Trichloromonas sp. TaxID=3069249 RepID=UPI003D8136CA
MNRNLAKHLPHYRTIAVRIALAYLLVSGLWILLSDQILAALVDDPQTLTLLQTYKGWLFVVVSSALLYGIVQRYVFFHSRHEELMRKVVFGISAEVGEAFFANLVEQLSHSLETDVAIVGRYVGDRRHQVETVAVFSQGKPMENFACALADSPCALLDKGTYFITSGAKVQYPDDSFLQQMSIEGFAGTQLVDSTGRPMGLIAVMSCRRLSRPQRIASFLQIFAARASAEMERLRAEAMISDMAYYDQITGLPNLYSFSEKLARTVSGRTESAMPLAIMLIDLDRFKAFSRTLGHLNSNLLLKEIVRRFRGEISEKDVLAKFGDDEFALLVEVRSPEEAAGYAERLLACLKRSLSFAGHELHLTASIGIAIYPHDGVDAEVLLKNADAAMCRTKEMGRNGYQFYYPEMTQLSLQTLILENKLHKALEREEFALRYQPQLDLRLGQISGMEALVCWNYPGQKPVPPLDFIPLAEETGLITPIGEWILRTACAQNKQWQEEGFPAQKVAVNISARQFYQYDIAALVGSVLESTGLDARWLAVEITESVLMQDVEQTIKILHRLKDMGVQVTIDDFGTGYSSLSYLKQFPVQTLKIDRSFIAGIPGDHEDRAITAAIIAMAHTLDIQVIAEGIEREAQRQFLESKGCDKIQGFLFSPPLSVDEFRSLLAAQQPPP